MQIEDAVVLVTGANRGLGQAFVQAALARGARKVYAAARHPGDAADPRVVPLRLDVTRAADAVATAAAAGDVTLLVNNAGISLPGGLAEASGTDRLRQQLETNCLGMLNLAQAFVPVLHQCGGGAMVNVLSALSWVHAPALGGYCVSKAAAWMLTNALRNDLRQQGTLVVGLHAGFIDTHMAAGFGGPKTAPQDVAHRAFDAVEAGHEEVLADEPARRAQAALSSQVYLHPVALG